MRALRFRGLPALAVLGSLTIALATACAPRVPVVDPRVEAAAREDLDVARARERAGGHAEAAAMFEELARQYPDAAEADEALFEAGQAWEAAKNPARARADYEALAQRYPGSDKAPQALARLAELGGKPDQKVVEETRDAFDDLPAAEKYPAAKGHAARAEAEGKGVEAFGWRERALANARTPAEKQEAEDALVATVEGHLSAADIERLADKGKDSSPATPILRWKLARIYLHLHDWGHLEPALRDFLARYPNHRYAPEARQLQDFAKQRGVVAARRLGVVLPLTGKYQAFGEQLLEGLKLAVAGSSIELVVKDDAGDPAQAAKVATSLVLEDHVIGLAGGVLTQEAQSVALKAQELGVPVISFSRSDDVTTLGDYVFRDMLTNAQMTEGLAKFAVESRGLTRFGVLHPELAYGDELAAAFKKSVEARGGKIEGEAAYAQDQTTFSEVIRSIVGQKTAGGSGYSSCVEEAKQITNDRRRKNAIGRCKNNLSKVVPFDAIFLPDRWQSVALVSAGLAFEDVITNWCDAKDIERIERTTGSKVHPVMLLGANLWNHPDLPARAGKYVNCSVFVDGFWAGSQRPQTTSFVQAFTAASGKTPGLLEAYGYDAGKVLRSAIEARKPATREALRETLLLLRDVPSAMGPTSVAPSRELVHPLYFLTVDGGTIRETDPALREGPP
jgi:ABC-type branched-subunit amino acid transport system substrate-binding protein